MDRFDSVHTCRFLPLVFLCHPSYCEETCCFRFHQEFLQLLNNSYLAMLSCSVNPLLNAVHMLLKLSPGQLLPSLTLRIKRLLFPGCFPFCHSTQCFTFHTAVSTSAYPSAFP